LILRVSSYSKEISIKPDPEACFIKYQLEGSEIERQTVLVMLQGLMTFHIDRKGNYVSSISDFFYLRKLLLSSNLTLEFQYEPACLEVCKQYAEILVNVDVYKSGQNNGLIQTNLKTQPFEDQKAATAFMLYRQKAINACSVGIGKTLSALVAFDKLKRDGLVSAGIVFVTNNGKLTWRNEIEKHTNFTYKIVRNGTEKVLQDLNSFNQDLLIVHYDCLLNESIQNTLCNIPVDFVIYDEAHTFRNMKSQRSEAIYHITNTISPKYRFALTGTPVAERPVEVFSILKLLKPHLLPSKTRFEDYFCTKVLLKIRMGKRLRYVNKIVGYKNLEQLKFMVDQHTYRKTHDDVEGFPPTVLSVRKFDMDTAQRKMYDRIKEETFVEIAAMPEKAMNLQNIITKTLRLRQYLVHPFLLGEKEQSKKFEVLDELLDEIMEDKKAKVLVWSSFRPALDMLVNKYKDVYGAALNAGIGNGLTMEQRTANIEAFISPASSCRLLACILDDELSASSNLGIARHSIYLDEPLSLLTLVQSRGRIQRRDAKGTSTLIVLDCEDTVDEWVRNLLATKEANVNKVINPDEELLSQESLLDVLRR
jgi:SNF2 family DNA or RNA helicase